MTELQRELEALLHDPSIPIWAGLGTTELPLWDELQVARVVEKGLWQEVVGPNYVRVRTENIAAGPFHRSFKPILFPGWQVCDGWTGTVVCNMLFFVQPAGGYPLVWAHLGEWVLNCYSDYWWCEMGWGDAAVMEAAGWGREQKL